MQKGQDVKFNLLIDELPSGVEVDGEWFRIATNFRTAILFELLMSDSSYSPEEKIINTLTLFYPEKIPQDVGKAMDAVISFYLCGEMEDRKEKDGQSIRQSGTQQKQNYSFEQDAAYIYASFLTQYGIDLNRVEFLHWWKFSALFQSLGEEHKISRIMYYRSADLKGKSKQERLFLKKMKKIYGLKNESGTLQKLTLAQRDAAMKEYVRKRFEEAGVKNGK